MSIFRPFIFEWSVHLLKLFVFILICFAWLVVHICFNRSCFLTCSSCLTCWYLADFLFRNEIFILPTSFIFAWIALPCLKSSFGLIRSYLHELFVIIWISHFDWLAHTFRIDRIFPSYLAMFISLELFILLVLFILPDCSYFSDCSFSQTCSICLTCSRFVHLVWLSILAWIGIGWQTFQHHSPGGA